MITPGVAPPDIDLFDMDEGDHARNQAYCREIEAQILAAELDPRNFLVKANAMESRSSREYDPEELELFAKYRGQRASTGRANAKAAAVLGYRGAAGDYNKWDSVSAVGLSR